MWYEQEGRVVFACVDCEGWLSKFLKSKVNLADLFEKEMVVHKKCAIR